MSVFVHVGGGGGGQTWPGGEGIVNSSVTVKQFSHACILLLI